jgi:hypothetical protein
VRRRSASTPSCRRVHALTFTPTSNTRASQLRHRHPPTPTRTHSTLAHLRARTRYCTSWGICRHCTRRGPTTPVYVSCWPCATSVSRQRKDCPVTSVLASHSSCGGVPSDTHSARVLGAAAADATTMPARRATAAWTPSSSWRWCTHARCTAATLCRMCDEAAILPEAVGGSNLDQDRATVRDQKREWWCGWVRADDEGCLCGGRHMCRAAGQGVWPRLETHVRCTSHKTQCPGVAMF